MSAGNVLRDAVRAGVPFERALPAGPSYPALALRALRRHPSRIAFRDGDEAVSYAAALDMVARMQAVLAQAGLSRGDRFALLSGNRHDAWLASLAAQSLGAAATSLHPMGSLDAHLFQLDDAGARLLIVDAGTFGARGGELAAARPGLLVFALGADGPGPDLVALARSAGAVSLRDLSQAGDLGSLNYTGGTTGRPKGVARSSGGNAIMSQVVLAEFEYPSRPQYLAVAPISHVSGTNVVPTLLRGGTVHMIDRFDPGRVLAAIEHERIDFTLLVPTMIYTLLDEPSLDARDLSSLQLLLYGASAMSPTRLAEGLARIGPVFSQLYGQSECYPIAALPREDHDPARPALLSACGFPAACAEVALLDDDLRPVAPGEPGEICVRSPIVMDGYWQQPALTEEAFRGGWLHTGDVARADDEGRLYIVDRKKDMIVTGGFNVYPREIEDVLTGHPDVAAAAVIGVPDDKWGEAVKAVVVPRPGRTLDTDALTRLVRERKGSVHAPKQVAVAERLPLTPLGKVDKKALRAQAWAGQARQVG